MKNIFKEDWKFLAVFTLFLVSTLSAVTYFPSEDVFLAEISYVNNDKFPYSIILNVENLVSENLIFDVEVVYRKENLVISSKKFSCVSFCEEKFVIKKVFFDSYDVIIKTKFEGKYYEKVLSFDLKRPKSNNRLVTKNEFFYNESSNSVSVFGKLFLAKPSKVILETYLIDEPSNKVREVIICKKFICDFDLDITSNIAFGKYKLNVYLPFDVLTKTYIVKLNENVEGNSNLSNVSVDNEVSVSVNSSVVRIRDVFGDIKEVKTNSSILKLKNFYNVLGANRSVISRNKPKFKSVEDIDDFENLSGQVIENKDGFLSFSNISKNSVFAKAINPKVFEDEKIYFPDGKKYIEIDDFNKSLVGEKRKLQPGVFKKKKITRFLDGSEQIVEDYFAYGLISINTKKPLYHKDEVVEFLIVVLDKWGYPVSDATIQLDIRTPSNNSIILTSNNLDIIETENKGVYMATIISSEIGKYDLYAQVELSDMVVDVNSFFNVVNFYEFDILREVPATIDPWQGPFNNTFTIVPLNNFTGKYNFTEVFSSDFTNITTDADKILKINDTIYLYWYNLQGKSTLKYTAQTPLVTPYLYYLGKSFVDFKENGINKRFYENRSWLFAIDPAAKVCGFESPCICGAGCTIDDGSQIPTDLGYQTINACSDGDKRYEYVENIRIETLDGYKYFGTGNRIQICVDYNCDQDFNGDIASIGYKDASGGWVNGDIIFETGQTGAADACLGPGQTYCINQTLTNYVGIHNVRGKVVWAGATNTICDEPIYYDHDDLNFTVLETRPAYFLSWGLDNGTTVGDNLNVIRGSNITIFAQWDKPIQDAIVTHNGSGIFTDYVVSNLNNNYTNYTADTSILSEFSSVGSVNVNITSWDLYFNLTNTTSPQRTFNIYGLMKINQTKMNPYIMYNGTTTTISCQVIDENVDVVYSGVNVAFTHNVSGNIGSSVTNSTGWASISYTENTVGVYEINCSISDQIANYLLAGSNNVASQILTVKENNTDITPPTIENISATPSVFSIGGVTTIKADVVDDVNLVDVYLNVTNPNGVSYQYLMSNIGGNTYEYNFSQTTIDGNYKYYIFAFDNSSNKGWSSDKSFTVAGIRTFIGIKTTKDIYKIGESINLTSYSKVSLRNSSSFYEEGDIGYIYYSFDTGFDGWVSGGVQNEWQNGVPNSGFITQCDVGTCLSTDLVGNYNSNADEWIESPILNFSGRFNLKVNYWRMLEIQDGTSNDRAYFEGNDGSFWYTYFQDSLTGSNPYTLGAGSTTVYPSDLDNMENSKFRFRLTSNANTNYEGWAVDSVNISFTPRTDWDKDWIYYNNSFGVDEQKITAIKFGVNITSYSSSGSDSLGTLSPDLEIQVYNGTGYSGNYKCSLDSTKSYPYYCFFVIKNTPEYLDAWKFAQNRSIRIRAINLDNSDFINWTNVDREYITPSIIENHGIAQVTSVLLEQFKNSTGGVVQTMYNQSIVLNSSETRQLSDYWSFSVPLGFTLGNYSAYVALTDSNGVVLQNEDDNTFINDSYDFAVQSMLINVVNPLTSSVQLEDFIANITLDTTFFASGGWCGYSLDGAVNVTMTQKSPTNFDANVVGQLDGEHRIKFYCNDSDNYMVESDLIVFNVSQNPRISFVSPTDINNSFVNRSWTYINVSVNDSSNTSAFVDFDNSLLGYWNFENVSGGVVYDWSSYSNNGNLVGDVSFNDSVVIRGSYGDFGGVDGYVDIASFNYGIDKQVSVEAWIYPKSLDCFSAQDCTILVGGPNSDFQFTTNNAVDFRFCTSYSANCVTVPIGTLSTNVWQHVVGTWDGQTCRLYKDGQLLASSACNQIAPITSIRIGQHLAGVRAFNGSIDEVRIWNRSLSWSEVNASYNSKVYELSTNMSGLKNGMYSYNACGIDFLGNYNCTENRIININKTLPIFTVTSPVNNSKYSVLDSIWFNASLNVDSTEVDRVWFELNSNGVEYNLTNVSLVDWSRNLSLNTKRYNVTFFGFDLVGNLFKSKVYDFLVIPDKHIFVSKKIGTNLGINSYDISLNITNLGRWKDYALYDFVDLDFVSYNYSLVYDVIQNLFGPEYFGVEYFWNLSINTSDNVIVNYQINGSGDYNLRSNYVIGID